MSNRSKIQELIDTGKLEIIGILAPVRTSSTIITRCFSEHPDIHGCCVQPYHLPYQKFQTLPYDRRETAFSRILDSYNQAQLQQHSGKTRIVLKEMLRNLTIRDVLEDWNSIVSSTFITARNPLLSIESLIALNLKHFLEPMPEGYTNYARKFLKEQDSLISENSSQGFLNAFALRNKFKDSSDAKQHFRKMVDTCCADREYHLFGELLEEFESFEDLNNRILEVNINFVHSMSDDFAIAYGLECLDDYAISQGAKSWDSLKEYTVNSLNFKSVAPLMRIVYSTNITGWMNAGILSQYLKRYSVIDASLFCANPKLTLRRGCEFAGLDIDGIDNMISFRNQTDDLLPVFLEQEYRPSLSKAYNSTALHFPSRSPISLENLPDFLAEHIKAVALSAYVRLISHEGAIRPNSKQDLELILGSNSKKDLNLGLIDPVLAYSLAATASELDAGYRQMKLNDIREKGGAQFLEVFNTIDDTIGAVPLNKYSIG